MDAMPPSSPPAIVRSSDQDAVDAVQRVIGLERWLIEQQAAMPPLPGSFDNVSLAAFLGDVQAWWSASPPETTTSTRRSELARRLASAMGDLAMLRGFDDSLDDRARRLATAVAHTRGAPLPDVELREVTFGDAVHAGTLLVLDTRESGMVLTFTSTRGWDHYADVAQAHAAIEAQARRLLTWRSDLPGLSRDTVEAAADLPPIGSRPIAGAPFDSLVDGLVAAQRAKIEQAWVEFELEKHFPARERRLADRLRDATRLSEVFDVEAILRVRDARLRRAVEDDRLATVSRPLASAWRAARDAYVDTLRAVSTRQEDAALAAPDQLETYAAAQLRRVLRLLGIHDDPRDIQLTLDRTYDPASRMESIASFFGGPASIHMPLLDAAYRNVPSLGGGIFSARGADGRVLDALNDKSLRILLNRLDIHTGYRRLLLSALRDGPASGLRKELFAEEASARMRRDAAEARVSAERGEWADRPHLGLDDGSWRRVVALLDATSAQPNADRKAFIASQVALNDIALRDVIELTTRGPGTGASVNGARPLMYYTPDAPDGATFRTFGDRDEADARFFHHPGFRDYLLERLPLAAAAALRDEPAGRLNANRSLRWVFGATETGGGQVVRVTSRAIAGDPFGALYDTVVDHSLLNASAITRSAADANADLLNDLWRRNPANAIPAQVAIAAVTAPFRVAPAFWRAYDAAMGGGYADAFVEASEGYVVALAAYSLGAPALHGATAPYLVNFRAIGGALTSRAMRRPAHLFDPRHLAEGIVRKGAPDAHGVHRIDGKPYAAVEDKLYRLEYEASAGAVRLGPVADSGLPGQAIRLNQGRWQPERQGWVRGGRAASAELTDRLPGFYSEYVNQLEQAFPDTIERQLVSDQMYREIRGQPTRRIVTRGQRELFHQALARAEEVIRSAYNIVPSLPGNLRRVSPEALPEYLWFYDEKPVRQSAFFAATRRGEAWGALRTEVQARNIVGARLTSVPPEAATGAIAAATGLRHLDRTKGFAVQVRVRDLLQAQPAGKPSLELLNVVAGRGDRYVLQTVPGRPLMLEPGQFRIVDELPPSPPP